MKRLHGYIKSHPDCLDEQVRGEKSTLYIFGGLSYMSDIMRIIKYPEISSRVLDIAFKGYRLAIAIAD